MAPLTASDVVVIGGVAAGTKAAATLARRKPEWHITLFERGQRVSYSACGLPYYASGEIQDLSALTGTSWGGERSPEFFCRYKGVEVVTRAEAVAINRDQKTVTVRNLESGEEYEHGYGKLVLATGATPIRPPFPCAQSDLIRPFTRPEDAVAFRRLAEQGKIGEAVVIGGGFIGCEMAGALGGLWGIKTTVIEREDRLLPYALDPDMAGYVRAEMERKGVEVLTEASVTHVAVKGARSAVCVDCKGETQTIEADYVLLCLGVRPESKLAADAGLAIGGSGGVTVNEHLQTSDPAIYAGGDCIESRSLASGKPIFLPMGSLANRHGRVIAEHIAGNETARFPGVTGAMMIKAFDLNVGAVGLSEQAASNAGISFRSVWGAFNDRPDYYPEHESFHIKLVYCPESMRLLGLQAVGRGDVCRRIDVLSSFLQNGGTVEDLLEFEHGYAPPYAEALDPLHNLASMALAQERGIGFVSACQARLNEDPNVLWLDVREGFEAEAAPVPQRDGRIVCQIPLGDLRICATRLDKSKDIYIVCRRGGRAYQAGLILQRAGFARVFVVGGGTVSLDL